MWLDNASDIDILFYEPYARIIADIAKNEQYNIFHVYGEYGMIVIAFSRYDLECLYA